MEGEDLDRPRLVPKQPLQNYGSYVWKILDWASMFVTQGLQWQGSKRYLSSPHSQASQTLINVLARFIFKYCCKCCDKQMLPDRTKCKMSDERKRAPVLVKIASVTGKQFLPVQLVTPPNSSGGSAYCWLTVQGTSCQHALVLRSGDLCWKQEVARSTLTLPEKKMQFSSSSARAKSAWHCRYAGCDRCASQSPENGLV